MVLVILAARSSLADHYHVPSGSMLPTVDLGDRILVNKLAYGFRVPFSNRYPVETDGPDYGPRRIPEDKYLLVGDNRGNSRDGRMFGLVDRSAILGRAEGIFLGRAGFTWQPL
jgi:hypothetical protein